VRGLPIISQARRYNDCSSRAVPAEPPIERDRIAEEKDRKRQTRSAEELAASRAILRGFSLRGRVG
jgi:hypothetical protein